MTGGENVYKYITTEGKVTGKKAGKITALEYLQKSTGVFNGEGILSQEKVTEMQARLKENKGNIWHGFVSLNKEQSYKIDTPEKCIGMIKATFGQFFKDAKLDKNNIDLMCALHLDRPEHLHFHFVFWEKEPKYKGKDGTLGYRRRGKIEKTAIDNLFVRLGLYIDGGRDKLYRSRVEAIRALRGMTAIKRVMVSKDEIKQEIISLAKDLPKTGRLNPVFPMEAQKKRMLWAGVNPDDFALMTSYENSHYCKPNPLYFKEIAERLGVMPSDCLMVGNDTTEDAAAILMGMDFFLLTDCLLNKEGKDISKFRRGSFVQLLNYVENLK
ncbi:MAG: HAD family hydrolase [Clostridia bacterium]|nr:HAD family hydrolase [Clostridia bacterium]MDY2900828.1 HAD family hydrolase [Christensenellaceae bacterium]